jgi:branched-chain amino acid transport system permease protein
LALLDLEKPRTFYWVALALTVAAIALLETIVRSPFGRALEAGRVNERRARSLGFPLYRIRLTAFVVSGGLAGVAGYFNAAQFGYVAPQMLGWHLSATALVMVVLGGMRSVTGPLLGAAILIGLEEVLRVLTEHWKLAEGLIIMVIVLTLSDGLRQLFDMAFGTSTRMARPRPASDAPTVREAGHA